MSEPLTDGPKYEVRRNQFGHFLVQIGSCQPVLFDGTDGEKCATEYAAWLNGRAALAAEAKELLEKLDRIEWVGFHAPLLMNELLPFLRKVAGEP